MQKTPACSQVDYSGSSTDLPAPVSAHLARPDGYYWTRDELTTIMELMRDTLPGVKDDLLGIVVARQLTCIRRSCEQPKKGQGLQKFAIITDVVVKIITRLRSDDLTAYRVFRWGMIHLIGLPDVLIYRIRTVDAYEKAYFWLLQGIMGYLGGRTLKDSIWTRIHAFFKMLNLRKGEDEDKDIEVGTELEFIW